MSIDSNQKIIPGKLEKEIEAGYADMDKKNVAQRLFDRDSLLWKSDEENIKSINNRMGWLDVPTNAKELTDFATVIKNEGYKHAVLLGMGGSSLCSEVARETFGKAQGYPELLVLDNTSPDAILALQKQIARWKRSAFLNISMSN
jgi:transaldolase/glucose-6-phosphate isomerase